MKVTTTELESSQVLLEIEVDEPRVERALDAAYRRLAQRVNVPGFRRGRAPRELVERMIGRESLIENAYERLVPEVYSAAIDEAGLQPIAEPTLQIVEAMPLRIQATVPIRPTVQLGAYRTIRREVEVPEVTADEIDAVIQQLREAHATWVPVERPVQLGDRVAMDVVGRRGETTILDRKDIEYQVRAESELPVPGFATAVAGHPTDEPFEFTVAVPASFANEELAGHEIHFAVQLHWVKEQQLPELDDSLAALVGSFNTLAELREHVTTELRAQAATKARRALQEDVIDAVVAGATLELPPQVVTQQADRKRQQVTESMEKQGLSLEQFRQLTNKSVAELDEEFQTSARHELQRVFVLGAIAEAEAIAVEPVEIEAEVRRAAGNGADAVQVARRALARPETREHVEAILRERKTIERLLQIASGEADGTAAEPVAAATEEPGHE